MERTLMKMKLLMAKQIQQRGWVKLLAGEKELLIVFKPLP
jgi:hypothetical protein